MLQRCVETTYDRLRETRCPHAPVGGTAAENAEFRTWPTTRRETSITPGAAVMHPDSQASVRTKLYAGFAAVSLALLLAVAVGWIGMLSVSTTVREGFDQAATAEATSPHTGRSSRRSGAWRQRRRITPRSRASPPRSPSGRRAAPPPRCRRERGPDAERCRNGRTGPGGVRVDRAGGQRHQRADRLDHPHDRRDRLGRRGVVGLGRAGLGVDRGDGCDGPPAGGCRRGPEPDGGGARPARAPVHVADGVGAGVRRPGGRGRPGRGPAGA